MIAAMEATGLKVIRIDNGWSFRAILVVLARVAVEGREMINERFAHWGNGVRDLYEGWNEAGRPGG